MTNVFQTLRAAWTFTQLVRNPEQLDKVFELVESTEIDPEQQIQQMRAVPEIAAFLDEPWSIDGLDLEPLRELPPGTLGREFADHMRANDLDPAVLFRTRGQTPMERVSAHVEQSHDIWHVVTGFNTQVDGELGLQAFYLAQLTDPPAAAIISAGLLHLVLYDFGKLPAAMQALSDGWTMGQKARPLFGIRWHERWNEPLSTIRAELGLPEGQAPLRRVA
ncbi:MAG: Coq4 family protein [Myxococcota bacterium]